jgi:NADPH-dependent 2,4-dienoyl-CoA reductase/sulfur reductase-like enzyme
VANVIPPQKAGHVAELAGVADRTGWCPVDPVTFESKLQPNIHVIGDAAIAGAMPRAA